MSDWVLILSLRAQLHAGHRETDGSRGGVRSQQRSAKDSMTPGRIRLSSEDNMCCDGLIVNAGTKCAYSDVLCAKYLPGTHDLVAFGYSRYFS